MPDFTDAQESPPISPIETLQDSEVAEEEELFGDEEELFAAAAAEIARTAAVATTETQIGIMTDQAQNMQVEPATLWRCQNSMRCVLTCTLVLGL